jgi:Sec-independent protein translocase protein TatA
MFGLGLWEIAMIALVIVVFVKPSELPRAARTVGRVVRRIQSVSAQARAEMRQLGAALERTDLERETPSPPDDEIHPMQTRPTEEDAGAGQGYIDKTSSGDAKER